MMNAYQSIKNTIERLAYRLPAVLNRIEDAYNNMEIDAKQKSDLENLAKANASGVGSEDFKAQIEAIKMEIALIKEEIEAIKSKDEGYTPPALKDPRPLPVYTEGMFAIHGQDYLIDGKEVWKCAPEFKQEVAYGPYLLPDCWKNVTDEYDMDLVVEPENKPEEPVTLEDPTGLPNYVEGTSAIHGQTYIIDGKEVWVCTPAEEKTEVNTGPYEKPENWTDVTAQYDMSKLA